MFNLLEYFFDDAKQGLLKDLVDFSNREDFDSYMKQIERTYYRDHVQNVSEPPYAQFPDYPPKP